MSGRISTTTLAPTAPWTSTGIYPALCVVRQLNNGAPGRIRTCVVRIRSPFPHPPATGAGLFVSWPYSRSLTPSVTDFELPLLVGEAQPERGREETLESDIELRLANSRDDEREAALPPTQTPPGPL